MQRDAPDRLRSRSVSAVSPRPDLQPALIALRHVSREYRRGVDRVHALEDCSLEIERGCFAAFMGPSGSGKSTLLNLVSGIDRPTAGEVIVAGRRLDQLDDDALARWRGRHVGLIFQFFNLVPVLDARDNVALPLLLTRLSRTERTRRAEIALRAVGLEHRLDHSPRTLSGGEQQRVAIARAVVARPSILLADEPTANLDSAQADAILEIFRSFNQVGVTLLLATHDLHLIERFPARRLLLDGGRLSS